MQSVILSECTDYDIAFDLELVIVIDVLPLAPGTLAEVGALWFDAMLGWGFDAFDESGDAVAIDLHNFSGHLFAGDRSSDSYGSGLIFGGGESAFIEIAGSQVQGIADL